MNNIQTDTDLRNKLTVWYASAMWKGKSLEEISKLPESNLQNGEENIDDLLKLIQAYVNKAVINELIIIGQSDPLFIYEEINKRINQPQKERDSTQATLMEEES